MSKLMLIIGILVAAVGIALGLMVFFRPGNMQAIGLTADTAAILFGAGLLSLGLGGVITAVEAAAKSTQDLREWLAGHEAEETTATPLPPKFSVSPPEPPEPEAPPVAAAVATAAAAAPAAAAVVVAEETTRVVEVKGGPGIPPFEKFTTAKTTTEETLASLEKAKSDLSSALGLPPEFGKKAEPEPEPEPEEVEPEAAETNVPEFPEEAEADADDEQLYVIEEKLVRGRPARVLSDGTVEAETDEGWMRFENTEHLEEYLDAVSPTKA